MLKLYVSPSYGTEPDNGSGGGIRRVCEAQKKYLPEYGITCVGLHDVADVVAVHAAEWVKTDKPIVSHTHGLYWSEYEWPNVAHAMNKQVVYSLLHADMTTAPSNWVANVLRRGMWLNPTVLYHGVDIEEWQPNTPQEYVLWNKTRVDAICDPVPMNKLAELAQDIKFVSTFGQETHNVNITGRLSYEAAKERIEHAGIYLCTSRETFGIGTLEAMSCGVPVLAWAWGGQREFVKHKENGWLAVPGDYEGLLEGLRYCIANRRELGTNARQTVIDSFQWKQVIASYAAVYEQAATMHTYEKKISVVVPCYNMQDYLPTAINSVLNQTLSKDQYEVVIVDDKSTDNSSEIADAYDEKNVNVRVIHNSDNLYLAGALNEGIRAARGKYIIPLDADNILEPTALEVLSGELDKNNEIDIAYGKIRFVLEDGVLPDKHVSDDGISSWPPSNFDFDQQLSHHNQIPSTAMYRKTVWSRTGGYRRRCRTAEDADFWCRASSLGFAPKYVTDAVMFNYRQRSDSMSRVEKDWDWTAWYTKKALFTDGIPTYEPPLITVVIPVGPGHENLVLDAVDSLVAQTFQQWECIVVNDTGHELLWLHPFVKLLRTTSPRSGPSVARNIGIKAAHARTFICLDADDYLQPNALEEMYKVYKGTGSYVYSDWRSVEDQQVRKTPEYDCEDVAARMPHPITALVPTDAWLVVNGFDETLEAWEDWDFLLAINAAGYYGTHIPLPLMHYRLSSGGRRETWKTRPVEYKQAVIDKWSDYTKGGVPLAGCMSCGGGKAKVTPPPVQAQSAAVTGDMVLLEFTGKDDGSTRTYLGKATGTSYRFGADSGHKVKYVHSSDAQDLLRYKEFKEAIVDTTPTLVSVGS
jgi:glycosyltransferase involved in cell wall biosynthesis